MEIKCQAEIKICLDWDSKDSFEFLDKAEEELIDPSNQLIFNEPFVPSLLKSPLPTCQLVWKT